MTDSDAETDRGAPSSQPPFPKAPNTWKWAALGLALVILVVAVFVWLTV